MKNIHRLALTSALTLVLTFAATGPAHAISCRVENFQMDSTMPITGAIGSAARVVASALLGADFESHMAKGETVLGAITTLGNTIAKQTTKQDQQNNAQEEFGDASAKAVDHQNNVISQAERAQDTANAALDEYAPSIEDCQTITAAMVLEQGQIPSRQEVTTLVNNDAKNIITGPQNGFTGAQMAFEKRRTQALNGGPAAAARYSDPTMARQYCDSPECYNEALKNMVEGILISSTGDRPPPPNTPLNDKLRAYRAEWNAWAARRASNRRVVEQILPELYVKKEYHDTILPMYEKAYSAGVGKQKLLSEYPRADVIGLDSHAMDKAQFLSLASSGGIRGSATVQNAAQRDRTTNTLQTLAAKVKENEDKQARFWAALDALRQPPPSASASALGISTQ